ncbi:MAG: hypothetical protein EAZ92_00810 [Candidatus Kapaibacterium sp.]|nr:MAG: hypothetical protein EAZ92_00810 [Candidatus Kapabacteria bacterium]
MPFTTYTTKGWERWDNVSMECYGQPDRYGQIIEANPDISITPVLPPNTTLVIPIAETVTALPPESFLPPWKRN